MAGKVVYNDNFYFSIFEIKKILNLRVAEQAISNNLWSRQFSKSRRCFGKSSVFFVLTLTMFEELIDQVYKLGGVSATSILEISSGTILHSRNTSHSNLKIVHAYSIELVKAAISELEDLGNAASDLDTIQLSITDQVHILSPIRPEGSSRLLLLCVVISRQKVVRLDTVISQIESFKKNLSLGLTNSYK